MHVTLLQHRHLCNHASLPLCSFHPPDLCVSAQEEKRLRKLEKKALELAGDVLKEMDDDNSGEISFDEFSRWWKEYKQKKSKGMFRGLFGKRKKAPKADEKPQETEADVVEAPNPSKPQLFGRSLVSVLAAESASASTPAFVQALFKGIHAGFAKNMPADQLFPGAPSQMATACRLR